LSFGLSNVLQLRSHPVAELLISCCCLLQPVVASGSTQFLDKGLWTPEAICAQHGDEPTHNALVNCRQGSVITNAYIRDFWNGFECIKSESDPLVAPMQESVI